MSRPNVLILLCLVATSTFFSAYIFRPENDSSKPEAVLVALRATGHELLLANDNMTSLVLPVVKSNEDWFEVSLDTVLSIDPASLVDVLNNSLLSVDIPTNYWAEVRDTKSNEVVYSYRMDGDENAAIIPCGGRILPMGSYTLNVKFISQSAYKAYVPTGAAVFSVLGLGLFLFYRRGEVALKSPTLSIGNYQLKKDERKLVYKDSTMNLTEKEIEILTLLSARPNQTISREELQREVWESKGVIVGRSLDTYVSKLRSKLNKDESVHIRNVHGSGYKLEVTK